MNDPIVIASTTGSVLGSFQGGSAGLTTLQLGAAAVEPAGVNINLVKEILRGGGKATVLAVEMH
jgi:hypothetical protein